LVTRLVVCYDRGLTEPALYALGGTCYYDGNPPLFFRFTLTPYHDSGLLQVGLISGSIVLNMILHNCIVLVTAAVVVTICWANPSSQLLKPCFHRIFGFK
jgi:hypothetical protein